MSIRKPGPDIAEITTRPVAGSAGIPCPNCGTTIELTLENLLVRRNFVCRNTSCRTVLTLDERASSEALSVIRKIRTNAVDQPTRRRPFR
jgi:hypothetical protein